MSDTESIEEGLEHLRAMARARGIPEDEYIAFMGDENVPQSEKPQWLLDEEARIDDFLASPEGQEQLRRTLETCLCYVAFQQMLGLAQEAG